MHTGFWRESLENHLNYSLYFTILGDGEVGSMSKHSDLEPRTKRGLGYPPVISALLRKDGRSDGDAELSSHKK